MAGATATSEVLGQYAAAVTTPWVEPPACSSIWDFVVETGLSTDGTTTTVPALYRDPLDPAFMAASCYPSGPGALVSALDAGTPFYFSPGVCPEGMTMTETGFSAYEHGGPRVSTAYCCSSGYNFAGVPPYEAPNRVTHCRSSITGVFSGPADRGRGELVTATDGYKIHDAWYLAWDDTDVPEMTPAPPEIKIPGQDHLPLILGLVFGLGGLLVGLVVFFIYHRRSRRRKKALAEEIHKEKGKEVARSPVVQSPIPHEATNGEAKGKGKGKQIQTEDRTSDEMTDEEEVGSTEEIEEVATASSSKAPARANSGKTAVRYA